MNSEIVGKYYQLAVKAEVLCYGFKINQVAEEIYNKQHPTLHKRTGNAGLQLDLGNNIFINAIYGDQFCEQSPYQLEKINGNFSILKNNTPIQSCQIIPAPNWYQKKTSDGVEMSSVFLQEGRDTLISALLGLCCYSFTNTQCGFCALESDKQNILKKPDQLAETVQQALKENPNYYIHLTGGNINTYDHGLKNYQKTVCSIREITSRQLSLEVSPPEDLNLIDEMVEIGVNGFSINLEVWDDKKRKEICPGKSQISKELYIKAWKRAVSLVGKFRVSSVLIVGLDTTENIKEGIKTMVKIGVKPTLIPLRPFKKSRLNNMSPPSSEELIELSFFAAKEMKKAGANPNYFVGCEHCGACSIEADALKIIN
jgi:radical SAM protein (TIGR04043 family)